MVDEGYTDAVGGGRRAAGTSGLTAAWPAPSHRKKPVLRWAFEAVLDVANLICLGWIIWRKPCVGGDAERAAKLPVPELKTIALPTNPDTAT